MCQAENLGGDSQAFAPEPRFLNGHFLFLCFCKPCDGCIVRNYIPALGKLESK